MGQVAPLTSALSETLCPQLSPTHGVGRRILYLNINTIHIFPRRGHPSCFIPWTKKYYWQGYSSLGTQTTAFLFHTPWIHASNSRCPWNVSFCSRLPNSLTVFQLTSDLISTGQDMGSCEHTEFQQESCTIKPYEAIDRNPKNNHYSGSFCEDLPPHKPRQPQSQTNPEMPLRPCLLCSQDGTYPSPRRLGLACANPAVLFCELESYCKGKRATSSDSAVHRGFSLIIPLVITEAWCANDEPLISPGESPASDSTGHSGAASADLPNMIKCLN